MKNKKTINIFSVILIIIIGRALFLLFDLKKLTFEKPALAIVYVLAIALSILFMIKDFKKSEK